MTDCAPDPNVAEVIAQGEQDLVALQSDALEEVDLADVIAQGERDLADIGDDRARLSTDPPEVEDP
ncbi:hypothetical protein [Streptomyces sp. NPDC052179]|uniref:hypothetical protein n=1 Tax=Streptomyces sp. NPDC052179 TaxID=3155680 RepID=UPI0034298854